MNPWKDLLSVGGHIATPAGLAALGVLEAADAAPAGARTPDAAHAAASRVPLEPLAAGEA
jgi:hypothetical protein